MFAITFPSVPDGGHRWKDGVLVALILGVVVGCWWAYQQGRASRRQMHRMLKDMESLRQAELTLDHLQKELQRARLEQVLKSRCFKHTPGACHMEKFGSHDSYMILFPGSFCGFVHETLVSFWTAIATFTWDIYSFIYCFSQHTAFLTAYGIFDVHRLCATSCLRHEYRILAYCKRRAWSINSI